MTKRKMMLHILALMICSLTFIATAQALPLRTFVSSNGNNANACSQVQPCRTFGGAVNKTQPGGEVVALDSGDFGVLSITKAITLTAVPGVYASLSPGAGKNGAAINAGDADTVVLRGLTFAGGAVANNGIRINTAGSVHIENCLVHGFADAGIRTDQNFQGLLYIKDTTVRSNGADAILIESSLEVGAVIDNCRLEANSEGQGLLVKTLGSNIRVTVRDTISAGNFRGFTAIGNGAEVNIERCVVTNNGTGILALASGLLRVSNSVVASNRFAGLTNSPQQPGTIESRGNNVVRGNSGGDISGPVINFAGK